MPELSVYERCSRLLDVPADYLEAAVNTWLESGKIFNVADRQEAARHALWHVGDPEGYEPGSFTQGLLLTWGRADTQNQMRLRVAFPCLSAAIDLLAETGVEGLKKWAEIDG